MISTLVMVWAVVVVIVFKPATLARLPKVTAEDPKQSRGELDLAAVASPPAVADNHTQREAR